MLINVSFFSYNFVLNLKFIRYMNRVYFFTILFLISLLTKFSWGQNLLLEENFDYPSGTLLVGTNGWIEQGTSSTNVLTIQTGNLSYPSYLSSNIGNYLPIANTGQDAYKPFTSQNSGSVYCAFLVNVSDAQTTGDYFFAFQPSAGSTNFTARFFIKKDASNNLAFGISKGTEAAVYTNFDYSLNTTYLVVVKYEMIAGSQNDIISVFINPTIPGNEPQTPTISTNGGTTNDATAIATVLIRQGNTTNAPTLFIDGIRVATTWDEAVKTFSSEAEILSFNIPNQISSTINSQNATVNVVMPFGTDLTNLTPTITISADATISPQSGIAQNFTNPVQYTVTAQDGITTKIWTVTVTVEQGSNEAEILSFNIPNQISSTINSQNATVNVVMPFGTDLTNLTPTITISAGATISPQSGVAQNFTNPVQYTVTAQNGTTKIWTVTVTTQLNNEAEILTFNIPNQVSSTINSQNATVNVIMPFGTDLTNLTPTITISAGATINPQSGVAQNFTNPVQYTVTAQNGTTKIWTVTVVHDNPVYVTLVEWTFPNNPDDSLADGGIPANLDKIITCTASGTPVYNVAGATTSAARATGWDNGADNKYWRVDFTTQGYMMIQFSSKQRSSSTGPKDFKVQYMINNDNNWIDVPNSTVTVADNFTSGVLNNIDLPVACENKALVSLRWIMTSNTSVNGSTVASAGASRIDDIIVKGVEIPLNVFSNKENVSLLVYPNPAYNIINIETNSKIVEAHILTLDGKIIKTSTQSSIYIGDLSNGLYLIKVMTENQIQTIRFVKQ